MFDIDFNKLFGVGRGGDQIAHFIVGAIVAIIATLIGGTPVIGAITGASAAVGKELYDKYIKGTEFGFFDMFATLLGTLAGLVILHLVKWFLLGIKLIK